MDERWLTVEDNFNLDQDAAGLQCTDIPVFIDVTRRDKSLRLQDGLDAEP